jgi:hypothetical protein
MNERIRELALQARLLTRFALEPTWPVGEVEYQKFAELIIEECAKISESVTPRHTECGNKIAAKIRQFHGDKNEMV